MSGLDDLQGTVSDLMMRQAKAVEQRLCDMLAARGIDPTDRTDGWEDRARAALGDLEIVDELEWSEPYKATITTTIRPRQL